MSRIRLLASLSEDALYEEQAWFWSQVAIASLMRCCGVSYVDALLSGHVIYPPVLRDKP